MILRCGILGRCDKLHFFHLANYQVLYHNNLPATIIQCNMCHISNLVWIEEGMGEISEVTETWDLTDVWYRDSIVWLCSEPTVTPWRSFILSPLARQRPWVSLFFRLSVSLWKFLESSSPYAVLILLRLCFLWISADSAEHSLLASVLNFFSFANLKINPDSDTCRQR